MSKAKFQDLKRNRPKIMSEQHDGPGSVGLDRQSLFSGKLDSNLNFQIETANTLLKSFSH